MIAQSYERIHRSNLVGMGVLPLQFQNGDSAESLGLDGTEKISCPAVDGLTAKQNLTLTIERLDGRQMKVKVLCRLDTDQEVGYFESGGILNHVLLNLM